MPAILNIKWPALPEFRFEYHPRIGKIYWMRLPVTDEWTGETPKVQAYVLAEHVKDEGEAFGRVQTFARGFREGQKSPQTIEVGR